MEGCRIEKRILKLQLTRVSSRVSSHDTTVDRRHDCRLTRVRRETSPTMYNYIVSYSNVRPETSFVIPQQRAPRPRPLVPPA
eukprot:7139011-Prymnesium_polylepis.1